MSISSVSGFLGSVGLANASQQARQERPASTLNRDLDGIREKGLRAWAKEQQLETLKQTLRASVLEDQNLTEKELAAMPDNMRLSAEAQVEDLIGRMIQEAMQAAVEEAAKTGKTKAVLLDISV